MKQRSFNTGHLSRGYPLSLPQTQERIENMKKAKQGQAQFDRFKTPQLNWKGK